MHNKGYNVRTLTFLSLVLLSCGKSAEMSPCENGIRDEQETAVDCGGGTCTPCPFGRACIQPTDCDARVCVNQICQPPSCTDGVQNGSESDIDCGGEVADSVPDSGVHHICTPCGAGSWCTGALDCHSRVCVFPARSRLGVCAADMCDDGARNNLETDVDCGGSVCRPCMAGQMCDKSDDCESRICFNSVCK
jgi:hypothetical protein